jgi:hypothetical protein
MTVRLEDFVNPEQLFEFGTELYLDGEATAEYGFDILAWYMVYSKPEVMESEERFTKELNRTTIAAKLWELVELGLASYDFGTETYSCSKVQYATLEKIQALCTTEKNEIERSIARMT